MFEIEKDGIKLMVDIQRKVCPKDGYHVNAAQDLFDAYCPKPDVRDDGAVVQKVNINLSAKNRISVQQEFAAAFRDYVNIKFFAYGDFETKMDGLVNSGVAMDKDLLTRHFSAYVTCCLIEQLIPFAIAKDKSKLEAMQKFVASAVRDHRIAMGAGKPSSTTTTSSAPPQSSSEQTLRAAKERVIEGVAQLWPHEFWSYCEPVVSRFLGEKVDKHLTLKKAGLYSMSTDTASSEAAVVLQAIAMSYRPKFEKVSSDLKSSLEDPAARDSLSAVLKTASKTAQKEAPVIFLATRFDLFIDNLISQGLPDSLQAMVTDFCKKADDRVLDPAVTPLFKSCDLPGNTPNDRAQAYIGLFKKNIFGLIYQPIYHAWFASFTNPWMKDLDEAFSAMLKLAIEGDATAAHSELAKKVAPKAADRLGGHFSKLLH